MNESNEKNDDLNVNLFRLDVFCLCLLYGSTKSHPIYRTEFLNMLVQIKLNHLYCVDIIKLEIYRIYQRLQKETKGNLNAKGLINLVTISANLNLKKIRTVASRNIQGSQMERKPSILVACESLASRNTNKKVRNID